MEARGDHVAHRRQLQPQRHRGRCPAGDRCRARQWLDAPARRREVLLLARGAAEDGAPAWGGPNRTDASRPRLVFSAKVTTPRGHLLDLRQPCDGGDAADRRAPRSGSRRWSSIFLQLLVERRRNADAEGSRMSRGTRSPTRCRSARSRPIARTCASSSHRVLRKPSGVEADDLIESKRGVGKHRLASRRARMTASATTRRKRKVWWAKRLRRLGLALAKLRARDLLRRPFDRAVRCAVRGHSRGGRLQAAALRAHARSRHRAPWPRTRSCVPPLMILSEVYDISPDVSAVAYTVSAPERHDVTKRSPPVRRARARGEAA